MRKAPSPAGGPAARRPDEQPTLPGSVAERIIGWQASGSEAELETLLGAVLPQLETAIERALHRLGIRDASAIDDTLSLILDHLRRLPGGGHGERHVAKFVPRPAGSQGSVGWDAGVAYLERLVRSRAIDVARRRQRRDTLVFSEIRSRGETPFEETIIGDDAVGTASPPLRDIIADAATRLEPRQRLLIELLLAGKSQAMIAHVLEVAEGTVSRLRLKAIESLRQILDS